MRSGGCSIIPKVPKYLALTSQSLCSKFLIKATQSHNLVSARFFTSDEKKLCCLIPNDTDCHVGLTSCLRLILRLSSMTKYQTNQGSSPVSPPFSITPCTMLTCHRLLNHHQSNQVPVLHVRSYSVLNT